MIIVIYYFNLALVPAAGARAPRGHCSLRGRSTRAAAEHGAETGGEMSGSGCRRSRGFPFGREGLDVHTSTVFWSERSSGGRGLGRQGWDQADLWVLKGVPRWRGGPSPRGRCAGAAWSSRQPPHSVAALPGAGDARAV